LPPCSVSRFGGAELCLSENPREDSQLCALVGHDNARALGKLLRMPRRIPLAKPWLGLGICMFKGTASPISPGVCMSPMFLSGAISNGQRNARRDWQAGADHESGGYPYRAGRDKGGA
jgi:hypothetical protein